jgi:hypothetical protein
MRNIKSWDLLIVENTLRTILNPDEAPRWLYQAARDKVGGSIVFEERSIPMIENIALFWRQHFTARRCRSRQASAEYSARLIIDRSMACRIHLRMVGACFVQKLCARREDSYR